MASNVFGIPVTDETLRGLPEYHSKKEITIEDRARVAMALKNAEGKDVNARRFVENLQTRYHSHDAGAVCTMVLIYNATGEPVTLAYYKDYNGEVGESPCPFMLANGQWGAFLHVRSPQSPNESCAGFLYSSVGKSKNKWFFTWYTVADAATNQVYSETGQLTDNVDSHRVTTELSKKGIIHQYKSNGCLAIASIGNVACPVFEAIMTLEAVVPTTI